MAILNYYLMVLFPNAKINIGLNIEKKRPDGYHNIASCFYPVGWSDTLEILPSNELVFETQGIEIPGETNQNLCLKAFNLIKQDFDIPNVTIQLLKTVPIGAGLGGGSSDAAFTIIGLNQLFELGLSKEEQFNYARQLGSDCAFFIENKPMYCFEKGDQFEEVSVSLAGKTVVLINPCIHISTIEAYAGIVAKKPDTELKELLKLPITNWKGVINNDFEIGLIKKHPQIGKIKDDLYALGAVYASMTGSGSTIYGIFDNSVTLFDKFDNCLTWQGTLK